MPTESAIPPQRALICLFLKAPEAGRVKTRLAEAIGSEAALEVYRLLVERQIRELPRGVAARVCYSPDDIGDTMLAWLGEAHSYYPQGNGTLGERLARAMHGAFQEGHDAVALIGGDCPTLDQDAILAALNALADAEVSMIPAVDGGYVLLATRVCEPSLFERIPWSTPEVATETRKRAEDAGLSVAEFPELEDVDDLASWERAERWLCPPPR